MKWTASQQRAIWESGNRIVSAGAGAGKTAVLTERIVQMVLSGIPLNRILVLTFTQAAAAEMRDRIVGRLTQAADAEPDPDRASGLYDQIRQVGSCYISTIHSFCTRIIRRHAHRIGLPPNPATMDDLQEKVLSARIEDSLLTRLAADQDADWHTLLAAFGKEDKAWNAVQKLNKFLDAQSDPEGWLDRFSAPCDSPEAVQEILDQAVQESNRSIELCISSLEKIRSRMPEDWERPCAVLDEELMQLRGYSFHSKYSDYRDWLNGLTFGRLTFKRDVSESDKKPFTDVRSRVKEAVKEQQELFSRSEEEETAVLADSFRVLSALRAVTLAYRSEYTAAKREKGMIDFSDQEHLALKLLSFSDIRDEFQERFLSIAIDEYQDSSHVQEALLESLTRGNNLFVVGDVKQSIYRFREAEPQLFLKRLNRYDGSEAGDRIFLQENFRSSPEILAAVNDLFETVMSVETGEMPYSDQDRLIPGAVQPPGMAELDLIEKRSPDNTAGQVSDAESEAHLIGEKIRALMADPSFLVPDSAGGRPLRYSDIAILLRASTHADLIARVLSRQGIPCYTENSGGVFSSMEVQVFLNLLRIIDNRKQDIPLLSVLRSSIGGFSNGELLDIRLACRGETPYYEAFFAAAGRKDPLGGKVRDFLSLLDGWHRESLLVGTESLVTLLLDSTGYYEEIGAMESGDQRQANLNALLAQAHQFASAGGRGISSFLREIDLIQETKSVGTAQVASAEVVRILTIHRSKGLEFPVVFLAQTASHFNLSRNASEPLQLHSELGIGLAYLTEPDRLYRKTFLHRLISSRQIQEQLSEEMRLLYVAMTRAKYRLYLTACVPNAASCAETRIPDPALITVNRARRFLDWVLMGSRSSLFVHSFLRASVLPEDSPSELPPFPDPDPVLLDALEEHLSWRYAYAASCALPAKASVSQIVRAKQLPEEELPPFSSPSFVGSASRKDSAFAGTASHLAVQFLPLDADPASFDAHSYLERCVLSGRLSREQADAVSPDAVSWFVASDLFRSMRNSPRLERELNVSAMADAGDLFGSEANEPVLLQGVIDCCFLSGGSWTVVDYKTDHVLPGQNPEEVAHRHALQVRLYASALERLTGIPVRKGLIVLLSAKAIVPVLGLPDN